MAYGLTNMAYKVINMPPGDGTISTEEKTVEAGTSDKIVTPSTGKLLSKVTVQPTPSHSKTVTPTTESQTVSPDSDKLLSSVIVNGDDDLIPSNIKSGVNIFGVTGTYATSSTSSQEKTVTAGTSIVTVTPDSGKLLSKVTVNPTPSHSKTVTPTATDQTVIPNNGNLLSSVTVNGDSDLIAENIKSGVDIFGVTGIYEPSVETETKTATAGTETITVTPSAGKLLSSVIVQPTPSQSKSVIPGKALKTVIPDNGKLLSSVTVSGDTRLVAENIRKGETIFGVEGTYETPSQTKTVTPTTESQTVNPDLGKLLSSVTVNGDPQLTPYNIKSDVDIFGVVGTYETPSMEKTVTARATVIHVTPEEGYLLDGVTVLPPATQDKNITPGASTQTVTGDYGILLSSVTVNGDPDLIPENIKSGVNIFGVDGTYETPSMEKTVTAGTSDITVTPTAGKLLSSVIVQPTPSQSKTVTPTIESQTINPDSGKLLSSVIVVGDGDLMADNIKNGVSIFGVDGTYDTPSMEKTVTAGTSAVHVIPEEGYLLSEVTVNPTPSQTKTVTPGASAQIVIPDHGRLLSSVTINGDTDLVAGNIKSGVNIFGVEGIYETPSQTKSVTPTAESQTVSPDSGKLLSSVIVNGDSDLIASNIKNGVDIFGVKGTYEPSVETETKTVTPTAASQIVTPASGKLLSSVTVNGDPDLVAENIKSDVDIFGVVGTYETPSIEKEVTAETTTIHVTPEEGYLLYGVTVNPTPSQVVTNVIPGTSAKTVKPDYGRLLSSVTVNGDPDLVAENIKSGVDIFGVKGTYEPSVETETKTVEAGTSNKIVTPSTGKLLSSVTVQPTPSHSKTVTPTTESQTVIPDNEKLLSSITVNGDPDLAAYNIKNGVDIFGVVGTYETPSETKTVTAGTSVTTVTPNNGKLLNKVIINPTPSQSKTVVPTAKPQTVIPDNEKLLSSVTVDGDVHLIPENIKNGVNIFGVEGVYSLSDEVETKTVTAGTSDITVYPSDGKLMYEVTVHPTPSHSKTVTPAKTSQIITPDSGKLLSSVTVNGDPNLIASNIKNGVSIFGVTGTMTAEMAGIEYGTITLTEPTVPVGINCKGTPKWLSLIPEEPLFSIGGNYDCVSMNLNGNVIYGNTNGGLNYTWAEGGTSSNLLYLFRSDPEYLFAPGKYYWFAIV